MGVPLVMSACRPDMSAWCKVPSMPGDYGFAAPTGPGVYAAVGALDEILYIGKANNLRARLRSHHRIDDFIAGGFTHFAYVRCHMEDTEELESLLIHFNSPPLNGTIPTDKVPAMRPSFDESERLLAEGRAALAGERIRAQRAERGQVL